jgi:hypothetical protein
MQIRFLRLAFGTLLVAPSLASAQEVRGVVIDSASRQPIPGAVIVLLDANRRDVGRRASSQNGTFTIARPSMATRVRVLRIGFRPRELDLPPVATSSPLEIVMAALTTLLETERVIESEKCPRRSDSRASLALWEQAKAGLLAAIVARDALPATMTNLTYQRSMEGNSDRIGAQRVKIHRGHAQRAFSAVHTAAEFARLGFVRDAGEGDIYWSPDAEVLLDDDFMKSYCLSLTSPDASRAKELGLSFRPLARTRGHVDIAGTVWIDTAARALRRIEFRYLGLDPDTDRFHPGGDLSFQEVRDGVPQIQRWSLRTVGEKNSSAGQVVTTKGGGASEPHRFEVRETGGELARATWTDGTAWAAPLGSLRIRATTKNGEPARGASVALDDTDYRATADSNGVLEIHDLLPGPYQASIIDPSLAALDLGIPTAFRFMAKRDSVVETTIVVPTAAALVETACRQDALWTPGSYLLIVRVVTPDGKPVEGAKWQVSVGRSTGVTGSNGLFQYCFGLDLGTVVQIRVSRDGELPTVVTRTLTQKVTSVRFELPARPK